MLNRALSPSVRRRHRRSRRRPVPASAAQDAREGCLHASSTRSPSGSRSALRNEPRSSSTPPGSSRGLRTGVESPPFTPHSKFDVGLSEGLGQIVDLGLQLGLSASAGRLRVVPSSQGFLGALQELSLPLRDRRLGHLQAARCVNLGDLAFQDAQNNLEFLICRAISPPPHRSSLDRSSSNTYTCPRNSDPRHISTAYERTSLIVTSNLPFESWTEVLGSDLRFNSMTTP